MCLLPHICRSFLTACVLHPCPEPLQSILRFTPRSLSSFLGLHPSSACMAPFPCPHPNYQGWQLHIVLKFCSSDMGKRLTILLAMSSPRMNPLKWVSWWGREEVGNNVHFVSLHTDWTCPICCLNVFCYLPPFSEEMWTLEASAWYKLQTRAS